MEDFEPIPPNDKVFNQEAFEKLSKKLDTTISDTGFKKLLDEQWHEMLSLPQVQYLSLEELVERYGGVLTETEMNKLKTLMNNGKD